VSSRKVEMRAAWPHCGQHATTPTSNCFLKS